MAKAAPAIVAFNAGELSPRLDGRVDLQDGKYGKGCSTLENFLPLVQGGALKRSGFKFVSFTNTAYRLVPFKFNTSDAYVIAFRTSGFLQFNKNGQTVFDSTKTITGATAANPVVITSTAHGFANGATVYIAGVVGMTQLNDNSWTVSNATANTFELLGSFGTAYSPYVSGGTASRRYDLASPYTSAAEIDSLQFAGQNDVLYIACPTQPPMKLSRFGDADWTLEEVEFEHFPFSPENLDEDVFVSANVATAGSITLTSNEPLFDASMIGGYMKLREITEGYNPEWTPDPADLDSAKYGAFRAAGTAGNWDVGDRLHYEGRVYETARRGSGGVTGSVPPSHDSGFASDGAFDWEFINYGYGYARIDSINDHHQAEATALVRMPLSTVSTPLVGSMTAANPAVMTTATHNWETGDKVLIRDFSSTKGALVNDNLYTITVLSSTTFSIPVNTTGTAGSGGNARRMDVARNATGAAGKIYPSLWRWSWGAWDDARGYPRSVLFYEDRLLWAGTSSNPQTCWASRTGRYEDHATFDEDDSALVFTLSSSEPIQWMAEQNALVIGTSGDEFSSPRDAQEPLTPETVNTIRRRATYGSRAGVSPVDTDNVLLFVQRAGRKLRELVFDDTAGGLIAPDLTRLADHITLGLIKQMAFQSEPNRLLWVVLQDGQLICMTYERDEEVIGWHRHPIGGLNGKVISVAVIPHPDGDGDQLWAIVEKELVNGPFLGNPYRSIEYMEKAWTRDMDLEEAVFLDSARVYDGAPTTTISGGLFFLVNQSVDVLADGVSVGPLTVSSAGDLTLPAAASKVTVGFGYDAVLSPMRIEAGSADGTAQGKTKRIVSLRLRLDQTGRGLYIGDTLENATEEVPLTDGELKDGDTALLTWPGGFETDGRIVLKHSAPTPCTITAILPRLQTND